MRPIRLVSLLLVLSLILPFLFSCGSSSPEQNPDARKTAPTISPKAEEDSILRRPDSVSDPSVYTTPDETDEEGGTGEIPVVTDSRVSFLAVGDNILHSAIIEDAARHAKNGAEYDFNYIYNNVRSKIQSADVAFVNQETPMGGKSLGYTGYPNFNGPQEAGDALVNAGFDIVCIATNHMADYKAAGLKGTIDYWNTQPVTLIGGYVSQEDYETIRVHEVNGIRIALLAFTYGINGMTIESSSGLVVPLMSKSEVRKQVEAAKLAGDVVIVNMHWGVDSSFAVTTEQQEYAQLLADLGVDVVIGEHPHVLQPMEWMTGKNGNKTLITYSIGNFLSTMYNDYFMVGGMLTFDIVKSKGTCTIENVLLIPTVTYYDWTRSNLSIYFLENFTQELLSLHGCNAHGASSLSKMRGYVTNVIPSEFLPDWLK
ncbi:MAG: CapA family protein [Clostridia bacterium]|nr:CapA family protein [Clostridia bacterium]